MKEFHLCNVIDLNVGFTNQEELCALFFLFVVSSLLCVSREAMHVPIIVVALLAVAAAAEPCQVETLSEFVICDEIAKNASSTTLLLSAGKLVSDSEAVLSSSSQLLLASPSDDDECAAMAVLIASTFSRATSWVVLWEGHWAHCRSIFLETVSAHASWSVAVQTVFVHALSISAAASDVAVSVPLVDIVIFLTEASMAAKGLRHWTAFETLPPVVILPARSREGVVAPFPTLVTSISAWPPSAHDTPLNLLSNASLLSMLRCAPSAEPCLLPKEHLCDGTRSWVWYLIAGNNILNKKELPVTCGASIKLPQDRRIVSLPSAVMTAAMSSALQYAELGNYAWREGVFEAITSNILHGRSPLPISLRVAVDALAVQSMCVRALKLLLPETDIWIFHDATRESTTLSTSLASCLKNSGVSPLLVRMLPANARPMTEATVLRRSIAVICTVDQFATDNVLSMYAVWGRFRSLLLPDWVYRQDPAIAIRIDDSCTVEYVAVSREGHNISTLFDQLSFDALVTSAMIAPVLGYAVKLEDATSTISSAARSDCFPNQLANWVNVRSGQILASQRFECPFEARVQPPQTLRDGLIGSGVALLLIVAVTLTVLKVRLVRAQEASRLAAEQAAIAAVTSGRDSEDSEDEENIVPNEQHEAVLPVAEGVSSRLVAFSESLRQTIEMPSTAIGSVPFHVILVLAQVAMLLNCLVLLAPLLAESTYAVTHQQWSEALAVTAEEFLCTNSFTPLGNEIDRLHCGTALRSTPRYDSVFRHRFTDALSRFSQGEAAGTAAQPRPAAAVPLDARIMLDERVGSASSRSSLDEASWLRYRQQFSSSESRATDLRNILMKLDGSSSELFSRQTVAYGSYGMAFRSVVGSNTTMHNALRDVITSRRSDLARRGIVEGFDYDFPGSTTTTFGGSLVDRPVATQTLTAAAAQSVLPQQNNQTLFRLLLSSIFTAVIVPVLLVLSATLKRMNDTLRLATSWRNRTSSFVPSQSMAAIGCSKIEDIASVNLSGDANIAFVCQSIHPSTLRDLNQHDDGEFEFVRDYASSLAEVLDSENISLERLVCGDLIVLMTPSADVALRLAVKLRVAERKDNVRRNSAGLDVLSPSCIAVHFGHARIGLVDIGDRLTSVATSSDIKILHRMIRYAAGLKCTDIVSQEALHAANSAKAFAVRGMGCIEKPSLADDDASSSHGRQNGQVYIKVFEFFQTQPSETKSITSRTRRSCDKATSAVHKGHIGRALNHVKEAIRIVTEHGLQDEMLQEWLAHLKDLQSANKGSPHVIVDDIGQPSSKEDVTFASFRLRTPVQTPHSPQQLIGALKRAHEERQNLNTNASEAGDDRQLVEDRHESSTWMEL